MWLALLIACSDPSDARRAADAARAVDLRAGLGACRGLASDEAREGCAVRVMERFGRFEGCDALTIDGWREECAFLRAESIARDGRPDDALRACNDTRFARQCGQHVLGGVAATVRDASIAEAAEAYARHAPALGDTERSEMDFWRGWFRMRIDAGLAVAPDDCPGKPCRSGARQEISVHAEEWYRAQGCAAAPPAWATSEDSGRWASEARARVCPEDDAAPGARPVRPGGVAGGGQPPAPRAAARTPATR